MGRPSSYKPEYCDMLIAHMKEGNSYESFAAEIDTHRGTLYNWEEKFPEFLDAKKTAQHKALKYWEQILQRTALGYNTVKINGVDTRITPNITAIIYLMKNRFRDNYNDNPIQQGKNEETYPEP